LRVKVLGLPEIKREKMGCFLAVTQGSEEPPRFLVIEHRHPKAKNAPVVLVGKGITFDTGGISLKDPPLMDEMKFDMSGAACVIGTMKAVAELNRHQRGRHRGRRKACPMAALSPGDRRGAAGHRRNPQHRRRI
jgi:leucyl aminopeptidase